MREEPAGCRQWGGREAGEEGAPPGLGASRGAGLSGRLLPQLPSLNLPLTGFCFLTHGWPNSTVLEQSTPWVTGTLLPKLQLTTGGQACESLGSQLGAPGDEGAGTCLQGPCTQCPPRGRPESRNLHQKVLPGRQAAPTAVHGAAQSPQVPGRSRAENQAPNQGLTLRRRV